ncbi:MAG: protein translocase subunit SecD [Candidatus Delongbacteria bacterium]|jgi:SecD/SecF fusion protein|nr:protein translocase subunit SecD [Candidatus Delongbacteria bacterium]
MNEHNNIVRWVIFALLFSWAIYSLIPTYKIYFSSEKEMIEKIKTKVEVDKIVTKKKQGEKLTVLENSLFDEFGNDPEYLSLAEGELDKIAEFEKLNQKSLALGLDLQGGMHLVLEIDYDQLLKNKAKVKDKQLEDVLAAVKAKTGNDKTIYFKQVKSAFSNRNISMNSYFGKVGDTDDKIIASLDSAAKKGIITTLEVLRNRIDQFGIAEPSIQKRGKHRIIVELPGVKDEERATNLVNRAAFLEFKLVAENEAIQKKFDEIDQVIQSDIPIQNEKETKTEEVIDAVKKEVVKTDTSITAAEDATKLLSGTTTDSTDAALTDAEMIKKHPFKALLIGGRGGEILVKSENKIKIDDIVKKDKVRAILGKYEFVWKNKPVILNEEKYYELFLVLKKAELDGTSIVEANATVSSGSSAMGGWEVPFELDKQGGRKFADITGNNIGRRLAIILDGKLFMAPNINSRIPNGRGVITLGGSSATEARDMAIVLKAGALEAPLEIMEKRIIGPSLGTDSINSGVTASIVGVLLVIVFMIIWYKLSGIFAAIALVLNLVFTIATLSYFRATLTLPGIAGIILTIGMSVDANVLIFERIKEELLEKRTVLSAVNAGYEQAFKVIFDANITTFIAGITLYQFGTGPIKGFALTLMIGIMWSMFTAVVLTRLLTDLYINKNSTKISV